MVGSRWGISVLTHIIPHFWGRVRGMLVLMEMDDLFPVASSEDIKRAGAYLNQYKEKRQKLEYFKTNPPKSEKEKRLCEYLIKFTDHIERAANQILDQHVKKIVDYRFIKGNSRAATIHKFEGWSYCDKTFDRKIIEGIESVANSLLYMD